MSNRSKAPAEQVERLLEAVEPDRRRRKVRDAVDRHFGECGRNDRRGRRSSELKKVATTLRHMVGMQRWVLDERYDLNVRRRIKDFLRHIDHRQAWSQTVDECRKARGLANAAARLQNEQKEFGTSEAVALDETHTSFPLNSVTKVRAAGRRGGNCLRDNDFGHLDEVRDRQAEFHEIRKSDKPVAWLRVDLGSREVTDIYGPRNEEADLPTEVLWQMCRKLGVNGDGEELLHDKGVLTIFLEGSKDPDVPMRVVRGYRFWWRRREIVVHDSREDRWSRFVWRRRRWCASGPSHLDSDTFEVMRRLEFKIRSIAWDARPVRPRRPRRRALRA